MNKTGGRNVVPRGERNVAAAVAFLLLLLPGCGDADPRPAATGRLSGRATVTDGDTLRVAGRAVRFQGVAAPERSEKGGAAATAFVREMAAGRVVTCGLDGTRTRGRVVGVCRVGGRDIGAELVRAGLARDCPRYSKGRYARLETPAGRRLPLPGYCRVR